MSSYGTGPGNTQPTQVPQQPQVGAPTAAPARKRSPLLIIGGIVVALVLVCVVSIFVLFGAVMNATQPLADAGNVYLTALRDGDYNKAFDLSTQTLQTEVGSAEGLQAALSAKQLDSWSFNSRNVTNDQGTLAGTAKYKTGESGTAEMVLNKVGNDWKVAGVSLK
ncbi:MAG: hypothetical protein ABI670_05520 [Chloroflexota bacterium]